MSDKTKIKITKDELVKSIAVQSNSTQKSVREFYNLLEKEIFSLVSSANEEQDIQIRLFEGVTLNSEFVPDKERFNNLTNEVEFVGSRIKPRFNISRTYCEKLILNK